jgi:hypothetical protein
VFRKNILFLKKYNILGTMNAYLPVIYGVLVITALFLFVKMLYSVYYTPGVTTIYNSPQAQKLFPGTKNKLFPTWGYSKAGMYSGKPFKYGQGQFWPESGKGFVPNKFGSPGASPSGGMRPTFPIPNETQVGFWGSTPDHQTNTIRDIYDNSSQHVEYDTPVGWWGN